MRVLVALASIGLLSSCAADLHSELAGLRAEIDQLERTVPPEAPLWISEGENAFPPFLDDHTARVPDFIYNHVLGKVAKMSTEEIDALTKGDFNLDECLKDPGAFRGRFYRVRGTIGILRAQPCDSDSGLREVHAGLVWNDQRPSAFHAAVKPEVLYLHSDLVEFTGIFLKILRFTTKEGTVVDAPFFLAKSVRKYY